MGVKKTFRSKQVARIILTSSIARFVFGNEVTSEETERNKDSKMVERRMRQPKDEKKHHRKHGNNIWSNRR